MANETNAIFAFALKYCVYHLGLRLSGAYLPHKVRTIVLTTYHDRKRAYKNYWNAWLQHANDK